MLIHKSVHVRREIWQKLRINSELSNAALRDYLAYLIEYSQPVPESQGEARTKLENIAKLNGIEKLIADHPDSSKRTHES